MGYDTDFVGEFKLDRILEEKHRKYLKAFSGFPSLFNATSAVVISILLHDVKIAKVINVIIINISLFI